MTSNRWRYSVRSLLLLTTALAITLCLATNLPLLIGVLVVIITVVLVPVALMYFAELGTAERRPILGAGLWSLFGLCFAFLALFVAQTALTANIGITWQEVTFLAIMVGCTLLAVIRVVFYVSRVRAKRKSVNDT